MTQEEGTSGARAAGERAACKYAVNDGSEEHPSPRDETAYPTKAARGRGAAAVAGQDGGGVRPAPDIAGSAAWLR